MKKLDFSRPLWIADPRDTRPVTYAGSLIKRLGDKPQHHVLIPYKLSEPDKGGDPIAIDEFGRPLYPGAGSSLRFENVPDLRTRVQPVQSDGEIYGRPLISLALAKDEYQFAFGYIEMKFEDNILVGAEFHRNVK